ncbi:MAG: hypothetical protein JWO05_1934 [Gemmatimonadetes bacterium]|nr:hypothetical protein [Gemmatimonadota bacterium]
MTHELNPSPSRRTFVGSLTTALGLAAFGLSAKANALPTESPSSPWDLSWIDALRGKHKQVFSAGLLQDGVVLDIATNWLDAHEEVFGLKHPDVNAVIGVANKSIAINSSDAIWKKYEMGRRYALVDPETGAPAVRNLFLHGRTNGLGKIAGVEPLQARGVVFWQCNNALTGVARAFARETSQSPESVRDEMIAGLNPGVRLVPAHTMVLGLVQEKGFTYEQVG